MRPCNILIKNITCYISCSSFQVKIKDNSWCKHSTYFILRYTLHMKVDLNAYSFKT